MRAASPLILWMLLPALSILGGCHQPKSVPVPPEEKSECAALSWGGFPRFVTPQPQAQFRCHEGFALEHSPRTRTALWVAQHLVGTSLDEEKVERREEFRADPTLPSGQRAELEYYRDSGWDRGHLAPAADFQESPKGMSQSFYLSNIVPQAPSNNRGVWANLEKRVRYWARQRGELYVWTGPIFNQGQPLGWLEVEKTTRRPKPMVAIPTHLYKVILDPQREEVIAFVIPNDDTIDPEAWPRYRVSLDNVQYWTGLSWFGRLPADRRQALLSRPPVGWE